MSCSRRWAEDIRTRGLALSDGESVTVTSCVNRDPLRRQALGLGPAHVARPAELFEDPDGTGGNVDLPAVDAVAGTGRIGMVQVVPALAERQDRQRPEVRRLVTLAQLERALADHVADRV